MIRRWFHSWERKLAYGDDFERRVLPFGWGVEYLPEIGGWRRDDARPEREAVHEHIARALTDTAAYYDLPRVSDYRLDGDTLTYTSPVVTGYAENDVVRAKHFPARAGESIGGPAVIVLPQWNAKEGAQDGLCGLLNRFGVSALKMTLPYHEQRMPAGLTRADYTLSPNVGRTLQSCRQAVLDTRAGVWWLSSSGYGPLGIVGTSLGSAIAFVVNAHEPKLGAAVFNHISPYFADVVWRGISTRQVREGLEQGIELDELRQLWLPLSPYRYYRDLKKRDRPALLIYSRYDLSFPPDLSREVVRDFRDLAIAHEVFVLPCGHYTTAKFPFNWMDGLSIARFLKKRLSV